MLTLEQAIALTEKNIADWEYPDEPVGLYAPIRYILSLKGKKIRPMLTLLSYNLYSDNIREGCQLARAWEIFHNFTLMHDDVMDRAEVRRGEPTVHKVWNENTAILSGDMMLVLAYKQIGALPSDVLPSLLEIFSETAGGVMEGQQYDMDFESRTDVTEEEYIHMIRLKTAILLGACLKSGSLFAGAKEKDAGYLYDFGVNLGIAFQIKDDYLDIYGIPGIFGKNIGGDIVCNKKTWFLVNALNAQDFKIRDLLISWMERKNFDREEKIKIFTGVFDDLGLKDTALKVMDRYYGLAVNFLSKVDLPESKKDILYELARKTISRDK